MSTSPVTLTCGEPGCPGVIDEGYCNVCGTPAPTGRPATAPRSATLSASPSAVLGTGIGRRGGTPPTTTPGELATVQPAPTGGAAMARPASASHGSARTTATGARAPRSFGSTSTLRSGQRLGAGLTTVPSVPLRDPLDAIMAAPEVPEAKRFCPSCGARVGRTRDGATGRTEGYCPQCGSRFDFDPQLTPGDVVGGQYEVVGCLAHGGLGWIYLGRDQNVSGRWVVLKGLLNSGDADAYAAAVAERQFLAEVEHPNIVEIYNFALHGEAGYTVMEYVGGTSLKDLLKQRREANHGVNDPLPVDQALAYIVEILPAFSYLHDRGLLFCDFKPDNIIAQGDSVKLIDLGGVRRIHDLASPIFGTVGYQAPEVSDVGPSVASDIYTIGRTLATLVLDFKGNTTRYAASLPPVADTAMFQRYDSFYRMLAKTCALNPDDRFGTVDELRTQLLGVLREVVGTDRGDRAAVHSAASVLFEAPAADAAERPLRWNELPALRADEHDPMATWLAGINVADPAARLDVLARAPKQNIEVHLARARAAIDAERWPALQRAISDILDLDPWEWRAQWVDGLGSLARGDAAASRASFNAVYGQVPGELAPKLALATSCELSHEPDIAESLYAICARTDANYTAAAAFGMARIRQSGGRTDAALAALDLVMPTRSSYLDARVRRASLLAASGRGLPALAEALDSVAQVAMAPGDRARLQSGVWASALQLVESGKPNPTLSIGEIPATVPALRGALERAYRELAVLATSRVERIDLVDRANAVRPWTTL